jgi:outer membrane protein assembly factor BamA
MQSDRFQSLYRPAVIVLLILLAPSLVFSSDDGEGKHQERADSIYVLRYQYSGRTMAENLLSIPGYLVYAPIKSVFEVQKFLIQQAFETRLIEGNFITKAVDIFISNDGKRGLLPTYSSRAGGGLKFYQKGLFTPNSKLSLSATVGLRGRQRYQSKFKNIEFCRRVSSQILIKYHFQSDESFYGIGPDSKQDDRTNFANELVSAELNVGTQISGKDRIGILAAFERNDISGGRNDKYPSTTDVASFATLPGMEAEVKLGKLQLEIHHDSRNHPGRPTSGSEVILRGDIFQQIDDDKYGFSRLSLDVSHYFHLFYHRTLKLRLAGELAEPFKNSQIPFYYLSELGRSETVRGFARGRFRDKDMVLGSIEYIYPIWEPVNAHLFWDMGTVASDIFKDFETSKLKNGYGIGFTAWDNEGTIGDFRIAYSTEGFRFYLDLNISL